MCLNTGLTKEAEPETKTEEGVYYKDLTDIVAETRQEIPK